MDILLKTLSISLFFSLSFFQTARAFESVELVPEQAEQTWSVKEYLEEFGELPDGFTPDSESSEEEFFISPECKKFPNYPPICGYGCQKFANYPPICGDSPGETCHKFPNYPPICGHGCQKFPNYPPICGNSWGDSCKKFPNYPPVCGRKCQKFPNHPPVCG